MYALLSLSFSFQHMYHIVLCIFHLWDFLLEMGKKRVVVRTSMMFINLIICMIIPMFQTVLSFTGAVPLIFLGITFPLVIYVRVFDCEMEFNAKMCIYVSVAVSVIFVFSYLVLSLMNILVWFEIFCYNLSAFKTFAVFVSEFYDNFCNWFEYFKRAVVSTVKILDAKYH